MGNDMDILRAVMNVNDRQPIRMIELLEKHLGNLERKKVAVLGLAFKAGTDDVRESRSISVMEKLMEKNAKISAYDPLAMENMKKIFGSIEYCQSAEDALRDADGCLIMTDWDEFSRLDFDAMKKAVVIDGRRVVENREGIIYEGICW